MRPFLCRKMGALELGALGEMLSEFGWIHPRLGALTSSVVSVPRGAGSPPH